jgi:hypothetical protein
MVGLNMKIIALGSFPQGIEHNEQEQQAEAAETRKDNHVLASISI